MAEIGEEVANVLDFMYEDDLCKHKDEPENNGWQCRIGKKGSPGELSTPTAKQLYDAMVAAGLAMPDDPPKKGGHWDLDHCTPTQHPFQSHHLIPKAHLPKHDVCVFLAKKKKNQDWELTESTNYDTDDARNGLALPFASNTYQWKKAKNAKEEDDVCNMMMFKTGKQLHQGSHTYEDYGEEDDLHAKEQPGYLGAVDRLLEMVHGETMTHVMDCLDCKKSASKPYKIRPLERVVLAVYLVSVQMENIIRTRKRFVSDRASKYVKPA